MKDTTEAFAVLKAIAERERPEIVSFGDSETMHATGIVGWLRGDGRWKLLDGFDPAMSYPERLEIRRQALMSDLFITGVNAISMEGSLHWLDKVGNRIAPVAFGPRKVVIVAGRNKIVADRAQAEDRIRTIAAPQNVARHPGFRTPCARTGVCSDCNSPDRVCNTRMEMLRGCRLRRLAASRWIMSCTCPSNICLLDKEPVYVVPVGVQQQEQDDDQPDVLRAF